MIEKLLKYKIKTNFIQRISKGLSSTVASGTTLLLLGIFDEKAYLVSLKELRKIDKKGLYCMDGDMEYDSENFIFDKIRNNGYEEMYSIFDPVFFMSAEVFSAMITSGLLVNTN